MRVGIDVRLAFYNKSGIYRYTQGLLSGFLKLDMGKELMLLHFIKDRRLLWKECSSDTDYVGSGLQNKSNGNSPLMSQGCFLSKYFWSPPHHWLEQFLLPFEVQCAKLDLVHYLDFLGPVTKNIPFIVTIHDLYFIKNPDSLDPASYAHYRRVLELSAKAAHVICDSNHTAQDLLEHSDVSPDRVSVVYPGHETSFASRASQHTGRVCAKYQLPERFILFVGTLEPRKNLTNILLAYEQAAARQVDFFPKLYLVGRSSYRSEEILSLLQRPVLRDNVRYLGEVSDDDLAGLYAAAEILLYCSLYEGFGFPILEAMACDTVVITSNNSSMKEIAQGAAVLVDPLDIAQISEAIEKVVEDPQSRRNFCELGQKRLKDFSWLDAAQKINQIYDQVLKN